MAQHASTVAVSVNSDRPHDIVGRDGAGDSYPTGGGAD